MDLIDDKNKDDNIANLFAFCKQHDSIFCFGTGQYAALFKTFLNKNNITVKGFIVTPEQKHKNPTRYFDLPVYSLTEVNGLGDDIGVVLSVHPKYHNEIVPQIEQDIFIPDLNFLEQIRNDIEFPQASICKNVSIYKSKLGRYTKIYDNAQISNSSIDDYSYIGSHNKINNTKIGKFCSLAPNIHCGIGLHPSKKFVSTHPAFFSTRRQIDIFFADKDYFQEFLPIGIGNDVWIGMNVVILDGVNIGNGAIIGAGAVVTKDIPDYAVVGGVAAKVLRYRFNVEQIQFLLKYPWWDKSEEWLENNYKILHDINQYISFMRSDGVDYVDE